MTNQDKIDDEVERRLDNLSNDDYDQWLDDIDGEISVGNLTFNASDIIKNCDEVAYRCGFGDFQESMRESIEDDVREDFDDEEDS